MTQANMQAAIEAAKLATMAVQANQVSTTRLSQTMSIVGGPVGLTNTKNYKTSK